MLRPSASYGEVPLVDTLTLRRLHEMSAVRLIESNRDREVVAPQMKSVWAFTAKNFRFRSISEVNHLAR
jgi:hypothetical protein